MSDQRLDRRMRVQYPDLSWTRIRQAIERGQVSVDEEIVRDPASTVSPSMAVSFDAARRALPVVRLDLPRLHEDDHILIVDKPAGLLAIASHPARRATEDTVLRRVQEYAERLHGHRGYAGMLHRLDRGTSGALAVALSREAHTAGRALFARHQFERWYLAIVEGTPRQDRGTVEAAISNEYVSGRRRIVPSTTDGRHAVTHYHVRERFATSSLVELQLDTGRQHQIRLHLQQLGHPLLGETVYATRGRADCGDRRRPTRPMLHAWRLQFPHPVSGQGIHAEAPLPEDFERLLQKLRRQNT